MNTKQYASVTSTVFIIVFLLHGTRFIKGWDMQFGPWDIPLWFSGVAAVFVAYLAWSGWKLR